MHQFACTGFTAKLQLTASKGCPPYSLSRLYVGSAAGACNCWLPDPPLFRWKFQRGCSSEAGATDLELSIGEISETLRNDYPSMFIPGTVPNFDIYADNITFELGEPFILHSVPKLHGKVKYQHALMALKKLAIAFTADPEVAVRLWPDLPARCLKVTWRCTGRVMLLPLDIQGVSLYSLGALGDAAVSASSNSLSHAVVHHKLEFIAVDPPFLGFALRSLWWDQQILPVNCMKHAGRHYLYQRPPSECSGKM